MNEEPSYHCGIVAACEPTFVGSDADISALSARMLNAVTSALQDAAATGHGWLLHTTGPLHGFAFPPDKVIETGEGGLQVRVSSEALKGMCGWTRTSLRRHGPKPETGGLAFGELNQAAEVLWVSEVEGPTPDSDASEHHFTCGVVGMQEANEAKRRRFRRSGDPPAGFGDQMLGLVVGVAAVAEKRRHAADVPGSIAPRPRPSAVEPRP